MKNSIRRIVASLAATSGLLLAACTLLNRVLFYYWTFSLKLFSLGTVLFLAGLWGFVNPEWHRFQQILKRVFMRCLSVQTILSIVMLIVTWSGHVTIGKSMVYRVFGFPFPIFFKESFMLGNLDPDAFEKVYFGSEGLILDILVFLTCTVLISLFLNRAGSGAA